MLVDGRELEVTTRPGCPCSYIGCVCCDSESSTESYIPPTLLSRENKRKKKKQRRTADVTLLQ